MNHGTMDHGSSTMSGMMGTATESIAAASASAEAEMDHGGMGMGGCQISMLWNWNTIDSCFISETWHVKSAGMFAGSCIGVVLLVICLEFLRRAGKEYDRMITQSHIATATAAAASSAAAPAAAQAAGKTPASDSGNASLDGAVCQPAVVPRFRPSIFQQAIRALLHTLQFAVAYFVMLLAMYYNGYIIICIFIGAYLGSFIFHWEYLTSAQDQTRAGSNPTVCCG